MSENLSANVSGNAESGCDSEGGEFKDLDANIQLNEAAFQDAFDEMRSMKRLIK